MGLHIALILLIYLLLPDTLFAGAWILPKKSLWTKVSFFHESDKERFCPERETCKDGEKVPLSLFTDDAENVSTVLSVDVSYALTDRLEIGTQIPYFRLDFEENLGNIAVTDISSAGFGDIRFFGRYNVLSEPAVVTVKIGVKAPVGKFDNDIFALPVGEGQWDVEYFLQIGRSLYPIPGYVNLDIGYRSRQENDTNKFRPGDEFVFLAEIGYTALHGIGLKATTSGLFGRDPENSGISASGARRQIIYMGQGIILGPVMGVNIETSLKLPVKGLNFPAGAQFLGEISYNISL